MPQATLALSGQYPHVHKWKSPTLSGKTFSLVEHLEKSSPLIIEEVRRWRDLLWDDYLDYKYREKRTSEVHNP
ncbi:hypothetical protein KBC77_02575 [Candidatus Saccharibacteria bacterium]|nr:hypothetical protein [Candidatus Saccharibacteria bacterium]